MPRWRLALVLSLSASALAAGPHHKSATGGGSSSGFLLTNLPKGKDVTMPQPATTIVPLSSRIMLTGTDMPQTLSFRPVNVAHGQLASLRLVIFDQNSDHVQYMDMQPNTPFLYPVKNLNAISVQAEHQGSAVPGLFLQIESDKPLTIAH